MAIAATLLLAGTIAAVCMQSAEAPKATGFGTSRDRRRVFYRGAVGNPRRPTPGHTAKKPRAWRGSIDQAATSAAGSRCPLSRAKAEILMEPACRELHFTVRLGFCLQAAGSPDIKIGFAAGLGFGSSTF